MDPAELAVGDLHVVVGCGFGSGFDGGDVGREGDEGHARLVGEGVAVEEPLGGGGGGVDPPELAVVGDDVAEGPGAVRARVVDVLGDPAASPGREAVQRAPVVADRAPEADDHEAGAVRRGDDAERRPSEAGGRVGDAVGRGRGGVEDEAADVRCGAGTGRGRVRRRREGEEEAGGEVGGDDAGEPDDAAGGAPRARGGDAGGDGEEAEARRVDEVEGEVAVPGVDGDARHGAEDDPRIRFIGGRRRRHGCLLGGGHWLV
ncbi:hypothetical protein SORBI_3004G073166 [Sorghum bicolor]|uniref:Uncharacterized protein n=1 Tax=Sorghum bicolor TaxID=4558 RepID=A0A1Z5RLT1_SORBI|nr:hypothetical protein SORBI_3004G073166 [Sorghum bicolor]